MNNWQAGSAGENAIQVLHIKIKIWIQVKQSAEFSYHYLCMSPLKIIWCSCDTCSESSSSKIIRS